MTRAIHERGEIIMQPFKTAILVISLVALAGCASVEKNVRERGYEPHLS